MVALLINLNSMAQTQFNYSQNWDSLLSVATKNNQLIFLDAYTDWCGWCKVMDRNTFADKGIGGAMNRYFVNVKYEMEKEEMGKKIALKYAIGSYPTYLIFNAKGELIYQTMGYEPPEQFMNTILNIVNPNNHIARPGYSSGFLTSYPDFYVNALTGTGKKKQVSSVEVNAWLAQNADLKKEVNWSVFKRYYNESDSSMRNTFWSLKFTLDSLYGKDMVADVAENLLAIEVQKLVDVNDSAGFEKLLKKHLPMIENDGNLEIGLRLYFYKETDRWAEVNRIMSERFKKTGASEPEWWNSQCWSIFERSEDSALLKNAAKWMEQVCKESPNYSRIDTYAALLYKAGDLEEALIQAKKALDYAKGEKTDASATEELIKSIESAIKEKKGVEPKK